MFIINFSFLKNNLKNNKTINSSISHFLIYDVSKNGDDVHWNHVHHDEFLRDGHGGGHDDVLEYIPLRSMVNAFQHGKLIRNVQKMC